MFHLIVTLEDNEKREKQTP